MSELTTFHSDIKNKSPDQENLHTLCKGLN